MSWFWLSIANGACVLSNGFILACTDDPMAMGALAISAVAIVMSVHCCVDEAWGR